jgi:hypothetical protein
VDTSDQHLVHLSGYCCTELPKACNDEWDLVSMLSSGTSGPTPPPPGSFYYQHLFFAELTSYCHGCKGPAIDISNSGGGHCRTCRYHPQGARHRCLQLRWWSLPDMSASPPGGLPSTSPTPMVTAAGPAGSTPRGPTINISTSGGGRCRTYR